MRGWIAAGLIVVAAAGGLAQGRFGDFGRFGGRRRPFQAQPNIPYDGRFTFVRVSYEVGPGGYWYRGEPSWAHGYPIAEQNLMQIMNEVSYLGAHDAEINTLALDDPELFKYPVAYMCEPGFWTLTDKEAAGLRAYLSKGGFLIVDDFVGRHFTNFAEQMRKVLPAGQLVEIPNDHPVFDSFFRVEDPRAFPHPYFRVSPTYLGVFEDNDPSKRLMMIVNYNQDVSEYWEWSDTNINPIDLNNEAYKLGVDYVIYGMTH